MSVHAVRATTHLVPHTCGTCGVIYGFPNDLYEQRKRDGLGFFCPNGHERYFTETDRDRLKAAQARNRHLEDQLSASKQEAEEHRRTILRERSRFARGVCPCCNRSFTNVRRHMETKHPDYYITRVEGARVTRKFRCSCGDKFDSYRGLRIHQGKTRWGRHETRL
jgi:uncharacterized protein with PIN domain